MTSNSLMPKISILMASYNQSEFLAESINSALSQTYKNIELIIVDDFSTDNSLEIIQRFAQLDSRLRVYSLPKNMGPGYTRNFAAKHASGVWLSILDADDIFMPEKIAKQVNLINKRNDCLVLVGSNSIIFKDGASGFINQRYPTNSARLKNNLVKMKRFPSHSSLMYRASAFFRAGGFNADFLNAEDYDLWLKMSDFGDFEVVPEYLIKYRLHGNNLTSADNGISQISYAYAANISYTLRKKGIKFAQLYTSNGNSLRTFIEWIQIKLINNEIDHISMVEKSIKNAIKSKNFLVALSLCISQPAELMKLLKHVTYGVTISHELASHWVSYSSVGETL